VAPEGRGKGDTCDCVLLRRKVVCYVRLGKYLGTRGRAKDQTVLAENAPPTAGGGGALTVAKKAKRPLRNHACHFLGYGPMGPWRRGPPFPAPPPPRHVGIGPCNANWLVAVASRPRAQATRPDGVLFWLVLPQHPVHWLGRACLPMRPRLPAPGGSSVQDGWRPAYRRLSTTQAPAWHRHGRGGCR
jgi:hypothetical protein